MLASCGTISRGVAGPRLSRSVHSLRAWLLGVLTCAALIGFGVGGAPAGARVAATPTTIASLHAQNQVHAWNDIQTWTDYRPDEGRWRVVVRSAGQISTPPAIPAGDERLAVDVGPGHDGTPSLAFVSCTDLCRVVVSRLDGSGAQTVPGSEGASAPTIWGSRVAWVGGKERVLTRDLPSGKVTRLPGVPRRKCYEPLGRRRCERPGLRSVRALELHGSRLALVVNYALSQGGGNGQTEVRMESVQGRARRLVALMNVGEGGQVFVGPSWATGKLFFFKSCPCGSAQGAYRFDPGRRSYAKARGTRPLAGFAIDDAGRRAFEALDPTPGTADRGDTTEIMTPLLLTRPLAFTPTRSPIAMPGA
jgi:hypothetical protein